MKIVVVVVAIVCLMSTRVTSAAELVDVDSTENATNLTASISRGSPCRAACWGAAALGCGIVGTACAGTTVITIGGATIPCTWAAIAACTSGTIGASLCSDSCPP